MSKLKCIVIEDEPLAVKVLVGYIENVPFLELAGSFKNALLAADFLHEQSVDLLFLDIHLPKLRGLDFLKTLAQPPAVIVTTAYHQYAVEGFELNLTDYLLKPFSFERFLAAVQKVKKEEKTDLLPPVERDYIFLYVQKKKVKIQFSDILFVESQREYVKVVTTRAEHQAKMSTHEIEAILPSRLFRRVHRSFIVSVEKIESFTAEVIDVGGFSIPIGRGFRGIVEDL
jgi:two-component system LytT family response regulator